MSAGALLAGTVLVICVALLLRGLLPARRQAAVDAAARRLGWGLRGAFARLGARLQRLRHDRRERRARQVSERSAQALIERARRAAREGGGAGERNDGAASSPAETSGKVSSLMSARERRDAQRRRH